MAGKVLTASYILNSDLGPGIAEADAQLAGLESSTSDLSDKVDGHTAAMEGAFNDLGAGIGADVGAGVGTAEGRLKDLDDAGADLSKDMEDHTSKIGSVFKSMGESLGNVGIPFSNSLTSMGEKMDETSAKSPGLMGALSNVGKVATVAAAAGVAAFAVASVKMSVDFQSAVDSMAASGNMSIAKAKEIGDAFNNMGGQTEFTGTDMVKAFAPVAEELATVQGHTLSAAQAVQVETAAANLATATHGSLTSSTSSLAAVMQAYGLKAGQAANASNVLFTTSTMTGNGLSSVATMAQKLHTQMGDLTPPLSQVGTLMVSLAEHGETGRGAISAVNSALTSLVKPVTANQSAVADLNTITEKLPPNLQELAKQYESGAMSSEAYTTATENLTPAQATLMSEFSSAASKVQASKTALDELGISVTNSKGNLLPLSEIFSQLHDKIQGETEAQQMATVSQVFGAGASRKLLDVIDAGPKSWDKASASVSKSNAADDAAAKASQALGVQMKIIGSAVEDEGVKFGNVLIPVLEDAGRDLVDVTNFFMHNKAAAIALGVAIGGPLVAAMTVFAVETAGNMISSLTQMGQKLLNLPATFSAAAGGADEAEDANADLNGTLTNLNETLGQLTTKLPQVGAAATELGEAQSTEAEAAGDAATANEQLAFALDGVGTSADAGATGVEGFTTALATAGTEAEASVTSVSAFTTNVTATGTESETSSTGIGQLATAFTDAGAEAGTGAAGVEAFTTATSEAGDAADVAAGQLGTLGATAETTGGEMAAAGTAAGDGEMAGGMAEGEGAATGLSGALGPLALGVGAVTVGAVLLGKAIAGATPAFINQANTAASMTADTLPQMTIKMGELKQAQDAAAQSMNAGGIIGQAAKVAYDQLGQQIDQLNQQHVQLSANEQILASNFGITKNQADEVAQVLGVNLDKALDPSQVEAFGQQVQKMGLNATGTATQISSMSGSVITALTTLESQTGTIFNPAAFASLGTNIDQGLASGIIGSQSVVAVAATGASEAAITAAKHNIDAQSPSRRAASEIGLPFGQGIAQGILASASTINSAARSVTGGALGAATVPSGVAGAGAGGAGGGGGINVYLTVQGHVMTDRDLVDAVYEGLVQKGIINGSSGQLVQQP